MLCNEKIKHFWFEISENNWKYSMNCRYGKGVFSFSNLIAGLTSSFNTEFQLSQVISSFSILMVYKPWYLWAQSHTTTKLRLKVWNVENASITDPNQLTVLKATCTNRQIKQCIRPFYLIKTRTKLLRSSSQSTIIRTIPSKFAHFIIQSEQLYYFVFYIASYQ